ncbi:MAG: hypothetical protein K1X83_05315 [Oligoflexia bacterium]|nr:hypothetical protein [Oligoflexia bacterium]
MCPSSSQNLAPAPAHFRAPVSEVFISVDQPELETLAAPKPARELLKSLAEEVKLELRRGPESEPGSKSVAALRILAKCEWKPTEELLIAASEAAFRGGKGDRKIIQALSEFDSPRTRLQLSKIAQGDFFRTEILAFLNDPYEGAPFSDKLAGILRAPFSLAGSVLSDSEETYSSSSMSGRGALGVLTIALAIVVVGEPVACLIAGSWALKRAIFDNPKRPVHNDAMQEFAKLKLAERTQRPENIGSEHPV